MFISDVLTHKITRFVLNWEMILHNTQVKKRQKHIWGLINKFESSKLRILKLYIKNKL